MDDFYNTLIENLYDGIYYVDRERKITLWNKSAERITGYSRAEVTGFHCYDNILRHVDAVGTELCIKGCPLHATLADGRVRESDVYLHHKLGHRVPVSVRVSPIRNEKGDIVGAVEIFSDNSNKQRILEEMEALKSEVYLDQLTGIGNRKYAEMNMARFTSEYLAQGTTLGVIIADIDHFKQFNDTYGHDLGDKVLRAAARSIANGIRKFDIAARWGGEEFIVLVPNVTRERLTEIAERVRMLVEHSWLDHEGRVLKVTISAGATLVAPDEHIPDALKRADKLLYMSKEAGRNRSAVG